MKRVYSVIKCLCYGTNLIANNKRNNNTGSAVLSIISFTLLLGLANPSNAQTASQQDNKLAAANVPAKEGTYQLIFNTRTQDANIKLNPQELMLVEKLRSKTEVVYARAAYSDDIRVKILPLDMINKPDFKLLPLKYFKDEHPYEEWGQIRYVEFE
jgi:hypothetical protein